MPIGQTLPFTSVRYDDILFLVLAASLLGSALLVVTLRDIIRSGLAMIAAFASLAGIYALLGNPLIAATQVLVYIGAISVLILFAIMLTQTKNAPRPLAFNSQVLAALGAAVAVGVVIVGVVLATSWPNTGAMAVTATSKIATTLFNGYVLPFEIVSVLLTAAVVGGVLLARRDPQADEEDRP